VSKKPPSPTDGATDGVALTAPTQTRNLLLFAACVGMQYLAAPVLYVGPTHAALLDQLGGSKSLANWPEVLHIACMFAPLLVTSIFHHPGWLKPLLVTAYCCVAAGTMLVAVTIVSGCPPWMVSAAVIVQAAVNGLSLSTAVSLVWEAMGRGVAPNRRGSTLALAYGVGPILAATGSLGSQALLTGATLGVRFTSPLAFPHNFALLFAVATVPMLFAAGLASRFVLPETAAAAPAGPRTGFFAGLAGFVGDPLLRRAALAVTLIYATPLCVANFTLYTREAMGELPSDLVMYQSALRFGTKAVAGLLLGWLLAKTHPLAGLLATGCLCLTAPLYATWATGFAYLATFQIYGAGELSGVYAPNYILAASRPKDIRRNLACEKILAAAAAPFGLLFGRIADVVGRSFDPSAGFRASFLTCAAIVGAGVLLALTLPRWPQPDDDKETP
jgi:hypothetical protein